MTVSCAWSALFTAATGRNGEPCLFVHTPCIEDSFAPKLHFTMSRWRPRDDVSHEKYYSLVNRVPHLLFISLQRLWKKEQRVEPIPGTSDTYIREAQNSVHEAQQNNNRARKAKEICSRLSSRPTIPGTHAITTPSLRKTLKRSSIIHSSVFSGSVPCFHPKYAR